jgi:hypothetical protein
MCSLVISKDDGSVGGEAYTRQVEETSSEETVKSKDAVPEPETKTETEAAPEVC